MLQLSYLVGAAPCAVTNMLTALNSANFQHICINLANLKGWHSHFTLNVPSTGNITSGANGATLNHATPNDLWNPEAGATAEVGGDAGG